MSRLIPLLFVFAFCSTGCVPVTEPVGDIEKAEPNKDLIGNWNHEQQLWVVDRPDVKGNPKGLMRIRIVKAGKKLADVTASDTMWIFIATVGKHTYANLLIKTNSNNNSTDSPDLMTEGAYQKWAKSKERGYWVGQLIFKDDTLTLDGGDEKALETLMKEQKVERADGYYSTKPGWLAEYLEKKGPKTIFNGSNEQKYTRAKKQ